MPTGPDVSLAFAAVGALSLLAEELRTHGDSQHQEGCDGPKHKTQRRRVGRRTVIAFAAAMFLVAAGTRAQADPFTVTGTSTGTFDNGLSVLGPLTFTGNWFTFTTEYDEDLGAEVGGTTGLGTFSLGSGPYSFTNREFTLTLNLTDPTGASPNPSSLSATLFGRIGTTNTGQVTVDYDGPATVTFATGSFDLFLNNVTLGPGQTLQQSGYVIGNSSPTSVPEPGSLMLLGAGLCLLAGSARRRAALQVS